MQCYPLYSFETLPPDIHTNIALISIQLSSKVPTRRDYATIHSLLLTSRRIHHSISPVNCPDLYATLFYLSFDSAAICRRMGPTALFSSSIAKLLKTRFLILRKLGSLLDSLALSNPRHQSTSIFSQEDQQDIELEDLCHMWLMMTENDSKNLYQLNSINFSGSLYSILTRSSTILNGYCFKNIQPSLCKFAYCLALLRMTATPCKQAHVPAYLYHFYHFYHVPLTKQACLTVTLGGNMTIFLTFSSHSFTCPALYVFTFESLSEIV